MKAIILSIFLSLFFAVANAQPANEKAGVMKVIKTLFEGMQKGDSVLARSAFAKDVTTATIGFDKNGKTFFHREASVQNFIKAIGTPHAESWNEMVWKEKILIDGNFAQAWMSYAFYLGKKFSHCGVDAFHLVKAEDGNWKIFHLADTRKKDGCTIPAKMSKQFK